MNQAFLLAAFWNCPTAAFAAVPSTFVINRNDLVAGVEYILTNTDVQNIIVETNGLADPA